MAKESLGIPNFGPWYLELLPEQDSVDELLRTVNFVCSFVKNGNIKELVGNNVDVKFINYGRTQLVFVVIVDNRKYTLLVNQPATELGVGKKEYDNLNKLNEIDSNIVIKPMYYHKEDNKELYMTPYYYQSRCVGVETTDWGVWKPEPTYHFSSFNDKERLIINSSMVATLIKLHNGKGLSKVRLDGGDFMLLKCYDKFDISYDNILNNIKLIAARDMIDISLDEYIDKLRNELSNNNLDKYSIVGKRLRCPLTEEEIETGIDIGLKMKKKSIIK